MTDIAGVSPSSTKLIAAFASVRREDYLGPGPWQIRTNDGYTTTHDTSLLYQDVLVALNSQEQINNGQPSLHANCLDALKICTGDTILHIGAGTGYYTAILAELTGPSGTIFAYEINDELSQRALENLENRSNIEVRECSGTVGKLPECDVIYVNAGVTGPHRALSWKYSTASEVSVMSSCEAATPELRNVVGRSSARLRGHVRHCRNHRPRRPRADLDRRCAGNDRCTATSRTG